MTFRSLYRLEARGLLECPIVGVAVDDWDVDQLVQRARESIEGTGSGWIPKYSTDSRGACRMSVAISPTPPRISGSAKRSRGPCVRSSI